MRYGDCHGAQECVLRAIGGSYRGDQRVSLRSVTISADGFGITEAARSYLAPLIVREAFPPFKNGLPDYVRFAERGDAKETNESVRHMKPNKTRWSKSGRVLD